MKTISPPGKGDLRPLGDLVQNNRWNVNEPTSWNISTRVRTVAVSREIMRKCRSKGAYNKHSPSATGRVLDVKTPPRTLHTVVLAKGLESIKQANDLRDACINDGMLQHTLDRVGFHGSVDDDRSNISSINSCKVVVANDKCLDAYLVVLEFTRELSRTQESKLLEVFAKHDTVGYLEWLGGATGWRFDIVSESKSWKRSFVIKLNTLQSVFTLFAKDEHKYHFAKEKRMVWRKHEELTEIVSDIRVWIEIIVPSDLTRRLLRSSNKGPDSVVHWAHHHPSNKYPLTVVTQSTMLELVEGVIGLFQQQFSHSDNDPLGKRWRNHEKRRFTDWKEAAKVCPEWTEDRLEQLLNTSPDPIRKVGRWDA